MQHGKVDADAVKAPNTGRQLKLVFKDAQHQVRTRFGIEIQELAQIEKVTISQKRGTYSFPRCSGFAASDIYQILAAQRSQSAAPSSKSYVLTSILTVAHRVPSIIVPARTPSNTVEDSYTGFYTFIVSIISLAVPHDYGMYARAPSEAHER